MSKKTAKRDKECLEYTESPIQLFKTENSVVYSEPKDIGTTERVKYVTTILVNFIINQGYISFLVYILLFLAILREVVWLFVFLFPSSF